MNLSYTPRLLCILIVVAGLVLLASQIALAFGRRFIVSRLEATSARGRERSLYLVEIGPALLAVSVAVALCLPAYLHSEPSREAESVSLACILIAAGVSLWFASAIASGLRLTLRTLRFARDCRRLGRPLGKVGVLPVLCVPYFGLPVALVGLRRPMIIVSAEFASVAGCMHPDALLVALAHEQAHAVHRDNWKLLSLAFLPRLDPFLLRRSRSRDLWQSAADWAADDVATRGDRTRAFLLAEVLVRAARSVHTVQSSALCTALTSAEAGLAARIDRLIHPPCDPRSHSVPIPAGFAVLALFTGAALALSPWVYTFSEWLLHLGAA